MPKLDFTSMKYPQNGSSSLLLALLPEMLVMLLKEKNWIIYNSWQSKREKVKKSRKIG